MSFSYWLMLGLSLSVNLLLFISILLRDKRVRDEKDATARRYDGLLASLSLAERRGLDRLKSLLDDLKKGAEENALLANDLEGKAMDQEAAHHQGKAAGFRELLARHRGW